MEADSVPRMKPMTPMNPNITHRLVCKPIFVQGLKATGEVQFSIDPIPGNVDVQAKIEWNHHLSVKTKNYGTFHLTPNGKRMTKEAAREVWNALVEFGWRIPE